MASLTASRILGIDLTFKEEVEGNMIAKIENPSFSYMGNNIVSVSGSVVIYADDGTTELYHKGINTKSNIRDTTVNAEGEFYWKVRVENALAKQAQDVIDKYKEIMEVVAAKAWPDVSTPDDALKALTSDVEAKLIV